MPDDGVKKFLWWFGLVIAPAVLIGIELFHPAHFTHPPGPGMYQFLSKPEPYDPRYVALAYPGPDWWFLLHMIQTPMVGLVAVGLWLLVSQVVGADGHFAVALAWLSRAATLVFLIYYTALDFDRRHRTRPAAAQYTVFGEPIYQAMFGEHRSGAPSDTGTGRGNRATSQHELGRSMGWRGGSLISHTGSYAVLATSVFATSALALARKVEWPALALLLAFGWQLQVSHASPNGPIAFGLLILSALWIWWSKRSGFVADGALRWPRRSSPATQ